MSTLPPNTLYYGDNLAIMQSLPLRCVDLIYLDPPFNSKKDYNLLYKRLTGKPVPEQAEAFCDTWEMDAEKEAIVKAMPALMTQHGVEKYYVDFWRIWVEALRHTQQPLLAYLIYMVQRLLYMKTILKRTGSIYLHCDPTASHYIKVMMDGIFGHKNFRSEIIWKRTSSHNSAKRWGPIHDTILLQHVRHLHLEPCWASLRCLLYGQLLPPRRCKGPLPIGRSNRRWSTRGRFRAALARC